MTLQPRAQATRETIIRAAVDVFDEVGYGATSLTDILNRAGVTKGAFYYHFPTKESVASAILEVGYARIGQIVVPTLHESSSALENLIRAAFMVAHGMRVDQVIRVGNHLRQAMPTSRAVQLTGFISRRGAFVEAVEAAKAAGDVLDDVDATDVADTIRAAIVGISGLVDSTDEAVFVLLAEVWRVILRGIVPTESLPYFHEFVNRMAQQHLTTIDTG